MRVILKKVESILLQGEIWKDYCQFRGIISWLKASVQTEDNQVYWRTNRVLLGEYCGSGFRVKKV